MVGCHMVQLNSNCIKTEKDIVPEPVEPCGVHPELGGQVDSQGQSAVHGVVEESPAVRPQRRRVRDLVHTRGGGGTCTLQTYI